MEEGSGYISVGGGGGAEQPLDLSLSLPTSTTSQSFLMDYCYSVDKKWMVYVNKSRRLRKLAEEEKEVTTQVLLFLEAALYLILTGMSMEQDPIAAPHVCDVYAETWNLFRNIVNRREFNEEVKPLNATILVLVLRCQSTLSFKLYTVKMPKVMDKIRSLYDYFIYYPVPPTASIDEAPPCSSSPPEGHPDEMVTIPVSVYSDMFQIIYPNMDLYAARDFWAKSDHIVEQFGIQDIFKQLDSQFGPLMLESSLVDVVRYVQEGLQMLKSNSKTMDSEVPL